MSIISEIEEEIQALYKQIEVIQNECSHPASTLQKIGKSDTGNWCKDDDEYWWEYYCPLCEKKWTEPQ